MPIQDKILGVCINAPISTEKGEAGGKYIPHYDVLNGKESIELAALHAILSLIETEKDKNIISTHYVIHEQANGSNFCEAPATIALLAPMVIHDEIEILVCTAPLSYASEITYFISVALSSIGRTLWWNTYVRLHGNRVLWAKNVKWRAHYCGILSCRAPKYADWETSAFYRTIADVSRWLIGGYPDGHAETT